MNYQRLLNKISPLQDHEFVLLSSVISFELLTLGVHTHQHLVLLRLTQLQCCPERTHLKASQKTGNQRPSEVQACLAVPGDKGLQGPMPRTLASMSTRLDVIPNLQYPTSAATKIYARACLWSSLKLIPKYNSLEEFFAYILSVSPLNSTWRECKAPDISKWFSKAFPLQLAEFLLRIETHLILLNQHRLPVALPRSLSLPPS